MWRKKGRRAAEEGRKTESTDSSQRERKVGLRQADWLSVPGPVDRLGF